MNKSELHKRISYWKSGIRIAGYLVLFFSNSLVIVIAGMVLVISELVGVAEEVWGA